jgi:hypothetical protein
MALHQLRNIGKVRQHPLLLSLNGPADTLGSSVSFTPTSMKLSTATTLALLCLFGELITASRLEISKQLEKETTKFVEVVDVPAAGDADTDESVATPCYPIPYGFCAGCPFGCSDTCYYTGLPLITSGCLPPSSADTSFCVHRP